MDRTRRQAKAAKDLAKRAAEPIASTEDDVLELEEVVFQTRERVKAAKASKARAAALRKELLQLQEEEESIAADLDVVTPAPPPVSAPVLDASDPGALVAATLKSAVIFIYSP